MPKVPGFAADAVSLSIEHNMSTEDTAADRTILPSLETPTLTKAELADMLFERLGLNKRESKDMVEAFFELVHSTLVQGEDVKLSGFGNFNIRRKAPRPGRNRSGDRRAGRRTGWHYTIFPTSPPWRRASDGRRRRG